MKGEAQENSKGSSKCQGLKQGQIWNRTPLQSESAALMVEGTATAHTVPCPSHTWSQLPGQ
jgi:hypothetical protein